MHWLTTTVKYRIKNIYSKGVSYIEVLIALHAVTEEKKNDHCSLRLLFNIISRNHLDIMHFQELNSPSPHLNVYSFES